MSMIGPHVTGPIALGEPEAATAPIVRPVVGYQSVVDLLRHEIGLGKIEPGQRLPGERELSRQLGVPRRFVRQALGVLEATGELELRDDDSGGGVFVREPVTDPEQLQDEVRRTGETILEFTEYRIVLELGAARLAAARRTQRDLELMGAAQAQLRAATTLTASRSADAAFHLAIAHASGNEILAKAIEEARVQMVGAVDLMHNEFIKESSWHGHEIILRAIRTGDARMAAEAMRVHIDTTRAEFMRLLAEEAQ